MSMSMRMLYKTAFTGFRKGRHEKVMAVILL